MHIITGIEDPHIILQVILLLKLQKRIAAIEHCGCLTARATNFSCLRLKLFCQEIPFSFDRHRKGRRSNGSVSLFRRTKLFKRSLLVHVHSIHDRASATDFQIVVLCLNAQSLWFTWKVTWSTWWNNQHIWLWYFNC